MTCFYMPNGETLYQYCKRNKISYSPVWARLDEGYSIDEAIKITKSRSGTHSFPKIICNGKYLVNICDRNKYHRIYDNVVRNKISFEEAFKRDELKYGELK